MKSAEKICEHIYLVGGSESSHPADCSVYLIEGGDELTLIDSGAGPGISAIVRNIRALGLSPEKISLVISTHAHIDHIGGNAFLNREFGCDIFAHELDADRIESGEMVGAEFYGVAYDPCPVAQKMVEPEVKLIRGSITLTAIHIPGHTPGSIALWTEVGGKRVLFGQDVHGPYVPDWGAVMSQVGPSLKKMRDLDADILCEGHFGIFDSKKAVRDYIDQFLVRYSPRL
ncbi:MAG: MBL fold metallo-hydrolase [Candidatus Abyssobacteria bacterium SURF_17]|uniref:MBL fold metallo-hydrolase n=1 Tax=Candidatus Abyssobacteria bacterium SURF_17 TaxID=2093361 RepID=A0A419F1E6_9BACT|nr:MAG: MBL fold metallo-hydrolase [Candidatus Abyssubacteria bacterium SURF_17]